MQGVTKQVSGWGGVSLSGTLLRVTGPLLRNYLVNRYMQDSDGGRKHRTCVRCMQGLCCGFVFDDVDSCRDVPQYKVMKYLVFGIIPEFYYLGHV